MASRTALAVGCAAGAQLADTHGALDCPMTHSMCAAHGRGSRCKRLPWHVHARPRSVAQHNASPAALSTPVSRAIVAAGVGRRALPLAD